MSVRNIALVAALAVFGGFAVWDYHSSDSKRARELRDIEKLAPDVQVPACYPKHAHAKIFAETVYADRRPTESLPTEVIRRGALTHDCIRGADTRGDVEHLADVLGDEGVPLFTAVIEKCAVDKLDVSPSACFAMDALAKIHSPKAVAALEGVLSSRKQIKDVWLGSLFRLTQIDGWRTRAQLAEMIPAEKSWEAKELLLERIRSVRDPAARPALQKAYEAETDPQEKGHLQAAILEIDNPGRCVVEDGGEGADGTCRYVCKDQNLRTRVQKLGQSCPLVKDADPAANKAAVSGVAGG